MLREPVICPRRVLITVDAVGGVWRYALDTARGLEDFGVTCLLVGFGPEPDHRQWAECDRLRNTELVWTHEPLDWMVADATALRPGMEKLSVAARFWDADLLHLNLPSQAAGLQAGVPVVVASHSCVPTWWDAVRGTELPTEWMWQQDLNRRGLQQADAIVVPSMSHGAALSRVYGSLPRLRVIHNATAVAAHNGPREQLILSVGRWWDSGKNGEALDKAAKSLSWPVVLAGPLDGPHGESAEFHHVQTTGPLPHDDVLSLMRRASIFAAPSRYEPFGLAVVEAAMSGAALVLSDIPTFRELWDGTALFVDANDVAGWSRALEDLAADEALHRRLAGQAALRAGQFTLQRQSAQLHDVYARTFASVVT
jgi:glycosyltransferase involved in cell wall biosynthesis